MVIHELFQIFVVVFSKKLPLKAYLINLYNYLRVKDMKHKSHTGTRSLNSCYTNEKSYSDNSQLITVICNVCLNLLETSSEKMHFQVYF